MRKLIEWRAGVKFKGVPKFPMMTDSHLTLSDDTFIGEKCVLFQQKLRDKSENSEPLPNNWYRLAV